VAPLNRVIDVAHNHSIGQHKSLLSFFFGR